MERTMVTAAAIAGFLAVAIGAFGAHALRGHFQANPELESTFQTAVAYHVYHALALLGTAWVAERFGATAGWAGYAFLAGILLFSGSLYVLSLTGVRAWGSVAPFGGAAFLLGWALLAWAALQG